jgi:preprotein translocase subunit Sss1
MAYWIPEILQEKSDSVNQHQFIRSIFYVIAIITFPLTNFIRHIQRRLIQTIPNSTPLKKRYFKMVMVSQLFMALIGSLGFILFIFGDRINNLYIFTALAFLGFFLHRPQENEYQGLKNPL